MIMHLPLLPWKRKKRIHLVRQSFCIFNLPRLILHASSFPSFLLFCMKQGEKEEETEEKESIQKAAELKK